ncbi:MAG: hypothetical protein R3E98_19805 [Gemmatimonadota bacterium]
MKETRSPSGKVIWSAPDGLSSVYETRIEVWDLDLGTVHARTRLPDLLSGFAGSGAAFENRVSETGQPSIRIWSLHVKR